MKKVILILACLVLYSCVFGQTQITQETGKILNDMGHRDRWTVFKSGVTTHKDSTYWENIKAGDTLSSNIFLTMPYMSIFATVADSNAATDSVNCKVELWQCPHTDTTHFVFVKTLTWQNAAGSTTSSTLINATGYWACNVNESAFYNYLWSRLRVIAITKHRVINDGVKFLFEMSGDEKGGQQ
jgi:hypothetical protein